MLTALIKGFFSEVLFPESFRTRLRYKVWGKKIQVALEKAESAGRETSDFAWKNIVKDRENDLKELQAKHDREMGMNDKAMADQLKNYRTQMNQIKETHRIEIDQTVNKRLAGLLKTVNVDDVIRAAYDKSGVATRVFIGSREATPNEINNLKAEILVWRQGGLYKIFQETMKWMAQEAMFTKSKEWSDVMYGKALLFALDEMDTIIKTLESVNYKEK